MRTTVEIPDSYRAKLLQLAAERGEKGFSGLVREALSRYLAEEEARARKVEAALSSLGSLTEEDADALDESVRRLRGNWR